MQQNVAGIYSGALLTHRNSINVESTPLQLGRHVLLDVTDCVRRSAPHHTLCLHSRLTSLAER